MLFFVCSQGIAELKADILKTTIHQKNMGEKVPHVYLKFEEEIVKLVSQFHFSLEFLFGAFSSLHGFPFVLFTLYV